MSAAGCGPLLDDLRAGGPLAVVFSRPNDDEDRMGLLGAQLGLAIALLQGGGGTENATATESGVLSEGPASTAVAGLTGATGAPPGVPRGTATGPVAGTAYGPGSGTVSASPAGPSAPNATPLRVRHFTANGSAFLDDGYLVKGVAGAIFWKLARAWVH